MPMRITCPNCGKQFSAWDDLVGKAVECPKCHQKTVIAGPNEALGAPPTTPAKKPTSPERAVPPVSSRPGSASPAPPAAKKVAPPPPPAPRQAAPVSQNIPPSVPRPTTKISRPPPSPPPSLDDDDSLPNGCPNCNATMAPNDDLCDACGYHLVLKKVIDISEMPKRDRAVGFERVLKDHLHDPESSANTLLWAKILGSLILLVVLLLCLGRWWWIGVLVAAGIVGLFWMKRKQAGVEASVNGDPISVAIWSLLLTFQRVVGWRKFQWPFSKARSLILCDPAFNDKELAALERLEDLEALDLEGTGLTDRALDQLRPLKQLKFLVLRRTQITHAAAIRLQQDLPTTMIWV